MPTDTRIESSRVAGRRVGTRTHALQIRPGEPFPLGATGTAGHELLALLGSGESGALPLRRRRSRTARRAARVTAFCWHGVRPASARAALRLSRAWSLGSADGHRCNPAKLLLDPYARAISGRSPRTRAPALPEGRRPGRDERRGQRAVRPRRSSSIPRFDWGGDRPPAALHET